jgi:hypothetical protein
VRSRKEEGERRREERKEKKKEEKMGKLSQPENFRKEK